MVKALTKSAAEKRCTPVAPPAQRIAASKVPAFPPFDMRIALALEIAMAVESVPAGDVLTLD